MANMNGEHEERNIDNEEEEELTNFFNELRLLDGKYGRNFRNLMLIYMFPEIPTVKYLEDISLNYIIDQATKLLKGANRSSWSVILRFVRSNTPTFLDPMEKYIADRPQSEWGDDWIEWQKWILMECLELQDRYPGQFGILLDEFLTPVHSRLVLEQDHDGLRRFGQHMDETTPFELFEKWFEIIYEYKRNIVCGYVFKILEPWLRTTKNYLCSALSHVNPVHFSIKPQTGLKKQWIRRQLDFLNEGEFDNILKSRSIPPRSETPSSTETPFQISTPLPNKGGFTAKVSTFQRSDMHKVSCTTADPPYLHIIRPNRKRSSHHLEAD